MLKTSYKPTRNGVLVKHVYRASGLILTRPNADLSSLKVLDKVVEAVGPDVSDPRIKPGVCLHVHPNAFTSVVIEFVDNENDINKVREIVKEIIKLDHTKATNDFLIEGYAVIGEQDVLAIVNSIGEEPVMKTKSIIVPPIATIPNLKKN